MMLAQLAIHLAENKVELVLNTGEIKKINSRWIKSLNIKQST